MSTFIDFAAGFAWGVLATYSILAGIVCAAIAVYVILWVLSWAYLRRLERFDRERTRLWAELDRHIPGTPEYEAAFEQLEQFGKRIEGTDRC